MVTCGHAWGPNPNPFRLVNQHWSALRRSHISNNKLKQFVTKNKLRLCYQSNYNLAKHLVRAKLVQTDEPQSPISTQESQLHIASQAGIIHNKDIGLKINTTKCGDKNCPLHGKLVCTNQARSKISNRAFLTRGVANCNTTRIVYTIQCRKCRLQYVGQTCESLKNRFI